MRSFEAFAAFSEREARSPANLFPASPREEAGLPGARTPPRPAAGVLRFQERAPAGAGGPRFLSAGDDTPFDGGPPLRVRASSCERNSCKLPLSRWGEEQVQTDTSPYQRLSSEPTSGTEWRESVADQRCLARQGPGASPPVCRKVASTSQTETDRLSWASTASPALFGPTRPLPTLVPKIPLPPALDPLPGSGGRCATHARPLRAGRLVASLLSVSPPSRGIFLPFGRRARRAERSPNRQPVPAEALLRRPGWRGRTRGKLGVWPTPAPWRPVRLPPTSRVVGLPVPPLLPFLFLSPIFFSLYFFFFFFFKSSLFPFFLFFSLYLPPILLMFTFSLSLSLSLPLPLSLSVSLSVSLSLYF